jgi:hypothetical protein
MGIAHDYSRPEGNPETRYDRYFGGCSTISPGVAWQSNSKPFAIAIAIANFYRYSEPFAAAAAAAAATAGCKGRPTGCGYAQSTGFELEV